jgi:starch synthase
MPRYQKMNREEPGSRPVDWFVSVPVGERTVEMTADMLKDRKTGVSFCFICNEEFFARKELYRDPEADSDWPDNDERFIFFTRSVLEAVCRLDWKPDIIHCHDWQAALVPVYLKSVYADNLLLDGVKTVLTIHNLGYQGVFAKDTFKKIGVDNDLFYPVTGPLEFFDQVNFLKAGIVMADKISTVSKNYAEEIQISSEYGAGLQDVLRQRRSDLHGIVNGVDYTVWSPSRDRKIPYRYNLSNLSGKRKTKIELLNKAGLPVRDKAPLIGIISRLVDQKGFDLVAEAADDIFSKNLQMIVLGTGDQRYHRFFADLERRYPDKLKVYLTFDDDLAHWIEAGADMFLMPSRYEPCGLNQLYSLKYGTVPIVRRVGGLADTVTDYDSERQTGTGFVFDEYRSSALLEALDRAVDLFAGKRPWTKLMKAGMREDFSWDSSAREYSTLFENVVG